MRQNICDPKRPVKFDENLEFEFRYSMHYYCNFTHFVARLVVEVWASVAAAVTGIEDSVSSLHLNLQIFSESNQRTRHSHFRRRLLIRSMRNEARMRNLGSLSKLAIAKARCDRLCSQASLILKDKFSDYHLTPRLFSIISQKIHIITSVFGTDNSHTRRGTPKTCSQTPDAVHILLFIFSPHFL